MLGPRSSSLVVAALIAVLAVLAVPPAYAAAPAQWGASEMAIEPLTGPLMVNGSAYRGRFHVRVDGGTIRLINEVSIEDYVRGIREMPPSWPIEAQRAQAIAARSYALHQAVVSRREGRPWDLCATASCQVYGGLEAEQLGGPIWERAVESTASQVLAYRGAPILAMYSSSNGGRTVAASKPYLRSVPDPDDAASPHHRWRVEVPEAAVGAAVDLPEGAELTGLERNGGVVVVRWAGPQPEEAETSRPIPVAEFRTRLEAAQPPPPGLPRLLPSTAFAMSSAAEPGSVIIEGRGWGHGVGMSQHGALGKARRGLDARRILAAYYAGLTPVKAAPGQVPDTIRVELSGGTLDLGGQGEFRVVADGRPVATGTGADGWQVSARKGRLVLTAPTGWQAAPPPQPATLPSGSDPFDVALAQAADPPRLAVVAPTRPGASGEVSGLALLLLMAVATAACRLRFGPDPAPIPRG